MQYKNTGGTYVFFKPQYDMASLVTYKCTCIYKNMYVDKLNLCVLLKWVRLVLQFTDVQIMAGL